MGMERMADVMAVRRRSAGGAEINDFGVGLGDQAVGDFGENRLVAAFRGA